MRNLETDEEFDDGGTPMWRARHAKVGPVIQIVPPPQKSDLRKWWDKASPVEVYAAMLVYGTFFVGVFLFLGLLLIIGVDYLRGTP